MANSLVCAPVTPEDTQLLSASPSSPATDCDTDLNPLAAAFRPESSSSRLCYQFIAQGALGTSENLGSISPTQSPGPDLLVFGSNCFVLLETFCASELTGTSLRELQTSQQLDARSEPRTTNITTSFAKDINISTHDNLTRGTPTSDLDAMATNTARTPAATRVSPTSSSSGIAATICVHKAKLANVAALTEFYDTSLGSHDVSAFRKAVEDAKSELDVVNKRLAKAKFEAQNLELEENSSVVAKDGVQKGGLRSKLFAEVGDPRVSAAVMGAKWVGKDIYAFHGDILQRQADAEVELVLAEKAVDVANARLRRREANLAVKEIYEKMWEKIDECHKLLDTVKRLRGSGDIESCLELLAFPKATQG
ncbi:hypothetical protein FDECE_12948 [Fusarium decemcellulare]|nr:hypothetical protein FDECE_12948 [Fusarium decemcellulare]